MFYADQRTVIAEIIRAWLVVGDQMEETKKFWCICFVQPLYLAILLGDHLERVCCQFCLESGRHS